MKELLKSVREYKKESLLTPLCMVGECLMETIIPIVMAYLIDKGINGSNSRALIISGTILIICSFFSLLFGILGSKIAAKASTGFAKNLRHDMYYKVQDYSFYNIDKFSSSSIVTRLTTDVNFIQMAYQMAIRIAVRAPITLILSFLMAFTINKKISLIFLGVAPILGVGLILISKFAHPFFEKVFKIYDDMNNTVQENIRGMRVVKSYAEEESEIKKFGNVSKNIYKTYSKAEKIVSINSAFMQICMYTVIILISWFSAHYIVAGSMSTGELSSLITYAGSILMALMMLSMIYVMCTIAGPSIKRCSEILLEESNIKNPENPIMKVKDGSICFKNVDFSYSNKKNKLNLKNINLDIKSGEVIGIIGGTGTSKSTLVNLIPRLYDVTNGNLFVGGEDVRNYDLKVLRNNVSMVLQKNVLFSGTIIENMRWGNKNATLDEIKEACRLACADEFIEKMEKGYDTYIEQGGSNVSGGQKQRLCIARALLKKPKILILDDSTSACDTTTDAKIRKSFREYIPEVTKIIIAQRISSVSDADKVIVLDNGKVVGFDTPANLLKNNKIYREVYELQQSSGGKHE